VENEEMQAKKGIANGKISPLKAEQGNAARNSSILIRGARRVKGRDRKSR
jgi:hypothetical protein